MFVRRVTRIFSGPPGEFSWNQGTSINILSTTHERKAPHGKILFFSPGNSLNCMRNLTHKWSQSRHFFPTLGHFFPVFEKGQGRPPPSLLQLCACLYDISFPGYKEKGRCKNAWKAVDEAFPWNFYSRLRSRYCCHTDLYQIE